METTFDFVPYDPDGNPKPGKSLQIRSRCMQGKNKREGSRRSQQEKKRASKQEKSKSKLTTPGKVLGRRPSIDRTFVCFDGPDIDASDKDLVFRTFQKDIVDHTFSHLEICVDFESVEAPSYEWLLTDDVFLQLTLCAAYAFNDFLNPHWTGAPSQKTLTHLQSTLSLLQQRLYDEHAHEDDSLIRTIVTLALLSAIFSDWVAATNHFTGLLKIVQLRGDRVFLSSRPKLNLLLDRIDLARSLTQGTKPNLLQPIISWSAMLPPARRNAQTELFYPPPDWASELSITFLDFQSFACTLTSHARGKLQYSAAHFQGIVTSLQSRLIELGDFLEDPTQQIVRLTMLSLLTPTIHVPGPRPPYSWILEQFKSTYEIGASDQLEQDENLHLWVLLTTAMMNIDGCPAWVIEAWHRHSAGQDWVAVRKCLQSVIWIGVIHDQLGESAFRQLNAVRP